MNKYFNEQKTGSDERPLASYHSYGKYTKLRFEGLHGFMRGKIFYFQTIFFFI